MNARERVTAAMEYRAVDQAPLQYYYSPVGYYEHGEKLNELFAALPGDFAPFSRQPIPVLGKERFDAGGRYHEYRTDEWGAVWEHRIFGVSGIVYRHPLADWAALEHLQVPALPAPTGPAFEAEKARLKKHQETFFALVGCGSLLERMSALRGDAALYCDLAEDSPEIHRLADLIAGYDRALVERAVALGADAVAFGDDYGTERSLLMSPAMWRAFFKPRLRYIFEPAVKAGVKIHFHSCGLISDIIEDLREVGATSLWPQLPAYDMRELAGRCRALGLAVAIHTDRANTMTFGTPKQVCELVRREYETFRMWEGGSWFYVEPDNGFPFENIAALVQTIAEWRSA